MRVISEKIAEWCRLMTIQRTPLILLSIYILLGAAGNLILGMAGEFDDAYLIYLEIAKIVFSLIVVFSMIISCYRSEWRIKDWGFTFDRKVLINLAIIVLLTAPRLMSSEVKDSFTYPGVSLFLNIIYATTEELVFRVILIDQLLKIFGDNKWGGFKAVLISSVIFAAIHIPIKDFAMIRMIFFSSLVMGYVYYYTRSVLAAMYLHVLGNTMAMSGYLGGTLGIIIYFIMALYGKLRERRGAVSLKIREVGG